jgi:hypothetical protein
LDVQAHTPLGQTALDLVHHLTQTLAGLRHHRRGGIASENGATTFHTRKQYGRDLVDLDMQGAHLSGHARLALTQSTEATQTTFDAFGRAWASHAALEGCTWNVLEAADHRPALGVFVEPHTTQPTRVWLRLGALPYRDHGDPVCLREAIAALDAAWNAAHTAVPEGKVGHHALEEVCKKGLSKATTWQGPVLGTRSVWEALAPFWVAPNLFGKRPCAVWSRKGPLQKATGSNPPPDAQALALDRRWSDLRRALRDTQVADALFVMGRDGKALLHIGSVEFSVQDMARGFLEAMVAWRPSLAASLAVRCRGGVGALEVFGGQAAQPSKLTGVSDLVCEGPGWMVTSMHTAGTCWMQAPFANRAMAEQAAAMLEPSSAHPSAVHLLWTMG